MEITSATQIFAALAQESRLAAMRLLIAAGPNGLSAGQIAGRLGLPTSTTSFHLSTLERAGLTLSTRQGRQIIYAVRFTTLHALLVFLTEACCAGRPDLCGDLAALLPSLPEEPNVMTAAFNVLFLCTRNSARSIMAEAILQHVGHGRFRAYSAGSDPATEPMSEVVDKLRSLGHDVAALHCKSWDEFTGPDAPRMDFVIALCDTLDNQICPDFGDTVVTGAWPLPDPAKFAGSAAERSTMLNELYSSLRRRIEIFTSLPFATLDRIAMRARLDEIGEGPVGALARRGAA
jgi:protein-tyrosine-phosphatase/DNA-binding transcriptional ArsR family regulator